MHCPYYSPKNFECKLSSGGVYIPLRKHLLTFCLAKRHKECKRYINREVASGTDKLAVWDNGRRRFYRNKGNFMVSLCRCGEESLAKDDVVSEKAITLDYGVGGVRILSQQQLSEGSSVFLEFGDEFIVPGLRGMAKICWQQKSESRSAWEAGLAFDDHFVQSTIDLQMNF